MLKKCNRDGCNILYEETWQDHNIPTLEEGIIKMIVSLRKLLLSQRYVRLGDDHKKKVIRMLKDEIKIVENI